MTTFLADIHGWTPLRAPRPCQAPAFVQELLNTPGEHGQVTIPSPPWALFL
jgi:hypothetical protein